MKKKMMAYLAREGGQIGTDLLHIFMARWVKPKSEGEAAGPTPTSTTTPKEVPQSAGMMKTTTPLSLATPSATVQSTGGTGCRPCTTDHMSTCSGALSEALRFARSDGMESQEVQKRLALCVDELNIWERVDASPENLASLSPGEKNYVNRWLPKGRELRHDINEVTTLDDLVEVAARAKTLSLEARQDMRGLRPPVMRQIEQLAEKVKGGQLTKDQALGQLKQWYQSQPAPR